MQSNSQICTMPNKLVYLYIMKKQPTRHKGKAGENQAVAFLRACGLHIKARNFRSGKREIDIIAQDEDCIVFIEVKIRKGETYGMPEEFVSSAQEQRILEAAEDWIHANQWTGKIRFDIIAISKQSGLEHIQDAFY